jgi:hypothetical protein
VFLDEVGTCRIPPKQNVAIASRGNRAGRGNETLKVVPAVAATNQDLDAMIEQGDFGDLYTGCAATLHCRRAIRDIPVGPLLHVSDDQLGTAIQTISQDVLDRPERYTWPETSASYRASYVSNHRLDRTHALRVPGFAPRRGRRNRPPAFRNWLP